MTGFPPKEVSYLLRLDGLVVFVATLVAYQTMGGNWWLFALLILAPDLAMLGALAGQETGSRVYNLAHSYFVPVGIGMVAWLAGAAPLLPFMVIWAAHIAADRALGYGLKYPGSFKDTHLGRIGKDKGAPVANAG
ncbi:MAG: DUF4260 family protein [Hyphomicrobiales bacterium]|nr:MAG: DUF4260 family protein [Hyphomicrobiales bacterium]